MANTLSPLAERIARGYAAQFTRELPASLDREDFLSVALVAAWQAEQRFDPTQGAKLSTWISGNVWRALQECFRHEDHLTRYQRKGRRDEELPAAYRRPWWIDKPVEDGDGNTLADTVGLHLFTDMNGYTPRLLLEEVWACLWRLDGKQRQILLRHFWHGETTTQIGQAFGVKKTRGQALLAESRAAFRAFYADTKVAQP